MIKHITDKISYIQATSDPLSADVGIIKTASRTWLYDVGCSNDAASVIKNIPGPKNIVLSHFHPDHIGNLCKLEYRNLYVGNNTYRYTNAGTVVTDTVTITDSGTKVNIFPIPSSHAKGSLAMEVDDKYLFVGDAFYPTTKGGKEVYNSNLLWEAVRMLQKCSAEYVLVSHAEPALVKKADLISYFSKVVALRTSDDQYIYIR